MNVFLCFVLDFHFPQFTKHGLDLSSLWSPILQFYWSRLRLLVGWTKQRYHSCSSIPVWSFLKVKQLYSPYSIVLFYVAILFLNFMDLHLQFEGKDFFFGAENWPLDCWKDFQLCKLYFPIWLDSSHLLLQRRFMRWLYRIDEECEKQSNTTALYFSFLVILLAKIKKLQLSTTMW